MRYFFKRKERNCCCNHVIFTFVLMNTFIQIIRTNKILIQFALFILLVFILIYRINSHDFDKFIFQFDFSLILAILLMPINWILEYRKWLAILNHHTISKTKAKDSFASGMISDFIIPGIPSNFLGRIFYFEPNDRIKLTIWVQLSNGIQFLITLLFGLASLIILNLTESKFILLSIIVSLFLVFLMISKPGRRLIEKFLTHEIQMEIKKQNKNPILLSLFGLSFFRFLIFSIQFALLLNSFGIIQNFSIFLWIWVSYLFVTLSPSLFMGNLIIRESITATLFSLGNFAVLPVVSATFLVWLINNFIPIVLAWLFITFRKST